MQDTFKILKVIFDRVGSRKIQGTYQWSINFEDVTYTILREIEDSGSGDGAGPRTQAL